MGWVTEKNGNVHRTSRTTCDATIEQQACQGTERTFSCKTDADCKEHPHGRCTSQMGQIGAYCGCQYSCETDADCGAGMACVCKGTGAMRTPHSVCAPAACSTDADCPGTQCGLSAHHNGCGEDVQLACRTPDDKCKSDADCPGGPGSCAVESRGQGDKKTWSCQMMNCAIGRPLVIEGEARTARPRERGDWRVDLDFDVNGLSRQARSGLAARHASVAAMEHASVASFSRFSLQLLSLGAPAELVAEAHRAALDEVEHARIGYAIASRLGGETIGPDRLAEATARLDVTVSSFVEALVFEGCVGETLGAAEGREVARAVKDEGLSSVLAQIADDEERHATLAWKTLQWALEAFGAEAREAASRALSRASAHYSEDPGEVGFVDEDFGALSARTLGALRREALREVVAPCARSLGLVC